MAEIVQILILGLALGGVIALMGSGLSLVFGVMRIVNLAHPSLIIGGAYVTYWGFKSLGIDPIVMRFRSQPPSWPPSARFSIGWCSSAKPKAPNIRK